MANSLLLIAAALANPVEPVMVLDELLTFADPARCVPAEPFAAILDQLRIRRMVRGASPSAIPDRFAPAFGDVIEAFANNGRTTFSVGVTGSWHGLPIGSIALDWAPGVSGPALKMHFLAPPQVAAPMLSAEGLVGVGRAARIETSGDGTLLTCELDG